MPIRIALGGDVNFSMHRGEIGGLVHRKKASVLPRLYRKLLRKARIFPVKTYTSTEEITEIAIDEYGGHWQFSGREIKTFDTTRENNPFKYIGTFFKDRDIACINLETPLSGSGRHIGSFCSHPDFAGIMKENNISIVSVANNHAFDAGERGFIETLDILKENNIKPFGGGMNIGQAREGEILKAGNVSIGFLGYTAICNSHFMSLAKKDQPGILPLYKPIVLEDITNLKKNCDFVVVAPHFDIEHTTTVHKSSIHTAHEMIDGGADLILGSHGHVPKPIEIYRGKLIIYCLGNLIFPFTHKTWSNNLLCEVALSDTGRYDTVKFFPIDSEDTNCYSPSIIKDHRGDQFLSGIKLQSEKIFGTPCILNNHCLEINAFNE